MASESLSLRISLTDPRLPATHNHPPLILPCNYLSTTHRSHGGNLIPMITNAIIQTWDRADLRAVTRGLDLSGASWACHIWNATLYPSHSMSGHAGANTRVHTEEDCGALHGSDQVAISECFLHSTSVKLCLSAVYTCILKMASHCWIIL